MLRLAASSLCVYCQRLQISLPHSNRFHISAGRCAALGTGDSKAENKCTVDCLCNLSVDIRKIRKLKGWVLFEDTTYANEIAGVLKEMGADRMTIASILEQCPEALLCTPAEVNTQKELWRSVCPNEKELVKMIEKFPYSFFTVSHHANQKANIEYFQGLNMNNRTLSKLMASSPQNFSNPAEKNKEMIRTLQEMYLKLGGLEANMKIWLHKLLSQNPFILMKPPGTVKDNVMFLQKRGFTDAELLALLSKLRGFIIEPSPISMEKSLAYSKEMLQCSDDQELKEIVLKCPALLYYSVPVLAERSKGLLNEGITIDQIKETPTVLELTTQIVQYRIKKLSASRYNIKQGSLEPLNGTKKEFEVSYGKIHLKKERPLFNPVAPLKVDE